MRFDFDIRNETHRGELRRDAEMARLKDGLGHSEMHRQLTPEVVLDIIAYVGELEGKKKPKRNKRGEK